MAMTQPVESRHSTQPVESRHSVRRTRGALSGILVMLLGAWGALVPFFGPSFNFGFTPDRTWAWTSARGWLEVLPGAAAAVGGLILLVSANRLVALLGGWLAAAAGAWYVVGPSLAHLLHIQALGSPIKTSTGMVSLQWLALFYGLGALILFVSAAAMGRLTVRSVADVALTQRSFSPASGAAPATGAYPAAAAGPAMAAGPAVEGDHNDRFHIHRHFGRRAASAQVDQPSVTGEAVSSSDASAAAAGDQQRAR
jgi:hypothetical protein